MVGTSNQSVPEMTINLMIHMGDLTWAWAKETTGQLGIPRDGDMCFLVLIGLGLNGNLARIPIFDMSGYVL